MRTATRTHNSHQGKYVTNDAICMVLPLDTKLYIMSGCVLSKLWSSGSSPCFDAPLSTPNGPSLLAYSATVPAGVDLAQGGPARCPARGFMQAA